jgi:hypothetical protein
MEQLSDVLERLQIMWGKLYLVLSSFGGWLAALMFAVFNFFLPEIYAFGVVLTAIFLDAFFGLTVAVGVRGDFALSKLGRVTVFKISAYFAALAIIFMVERLLHQEGGFIGVKVAAGWAAACEFWSLSASVLVIWPDAPFFKIMRKQLKGEIESKLGKKVSDVLK